MSNSQQYSCVSLYFHLWTYFTQFEKKYLGTKQTWQIILYSENQKPKGVWNCKKVQWKTNGSFYKYHAMLTHTIT